jgi:hypothetical protein
VSAGKKRPAKVAGTAAAKKVANIKTAAKAVANRKRKAS